MTLAIIMECNRTFSALSDVMVSTTSGEEIPSATTVFLSSDRRDREQQELRQSKLFQKTYVINPGLLFVWASNFIQARSLFFYLSKLFHQYVPSSSELRKAISEHEDTTEDLECVLVIRGRYRLEYVDINTVGYELETVNMLYTMGKGTQDFVPSAHLRQIKGAASGTESALISLTFAADAMLRRAHSGFGLDNSWGSGFEITVFDGCFIKLNNVLIRGWFVTLFEDPPKLKQSDIAFYQTYVEDDLFTFPIVSRSGLAFQSKGFLSNSAIKTVSHAQSPTHIVDLIQYLTSPDRMILGAMCSSVRADQNMPVRVVLQKGGHRIVRDEGEEQSLLEHALEHYRTISGGGNVEFVDTGGKS